MPISSAGKLPRITPAQCFDRFSPHVGRAAENRQHHKRPRGRRVINLAQHLHGDLLERCIAPCEGRPHHRHGPSIGDLRQGFLGFGLARCVLALQAGPQTLQNGPPVFIGLFCSWASTFAAAASSGLTQCPPIFLKPRCFQALSRLGSSCTTR